MKLLLDTHTFLWHAHSDSRLSATAAALLTDPTNGLFLSMASVWEIAIKTGLGKLVLATPFISFMTTAITGYGITVMAISLGDCAEYEQLPFPNPGHRDPFDRMIVVHAQRHGLSLVGTDAAFDAYGITRLW